MRAPVTAVRSEIRLYVSTNELLCQAEQPFDPFLDVASSSFLDPTRGTACLFSVFQERDLDSDEGFARGTLLKTCFNVTGREDQERG